MTDLRQALLECGKDLTPAVREAVVAAGQQAVPVLLELLREASLGEDDETDEADDLDELDEMDDLDEDEETEESDDSPEGWAPIHAAVLLGELRAPEAVEPLLAAYQDSTWDDYLKDRSLAALHKIGAPALEATLRALESADDDQQRDDLCAVLGSLGVRDERVFNQLLALLARDTERGATELSSYGDARALPVLFEALDRHQVELGGLGVDQTLIELAAAVETLGGKLRPEDEARLARMDELRAARGRPKRWDRASLSDVGRLLVRSADELEPAARAEILSKGSEAVGALIEVLVEPGLQDEDSPGEGWAPIHAATLLGELRAPEAAEPLIAAFVKSDKANDFRNAAGLALQKLGTLAVEASLRAIDAATEDEELDELVILLANLKVRDDRILQRLLVQLELDPENVSAQLVNYGDPRAVPALIAELDLYPSKVTREDLLDAAFPSLINAVLDLGGKVPPKHQARFEKTRRLFRETGALGAAMDSPQVPVVRRERPGRNDPCWCGSEKKYKKCHLEADEAGGNP